MTQAAEQLTNYEAALKAETRRVVRNYQPYSSDQRANHAASFRLGHRQRLADGEFFYTHPDIPNRCFDTRGQAARAGLEA
jgi:Zn-dependent protease with chaperone function